MITANITDFLGTVRDALQDQQKTRWADVELQRYLDQGLRAVALESMYNRLNEEISVVVGTSNYSVDKEIIKYHNIESTQAYTVQDDSSITFTDPTEETVEVEYFAFPDRIVYGVTTTITLDIDLFDALRFYTIYRAYQKEASTEHIKKAQYFKGEYQQQLAQNSTRWHGQEDITLYKNDYLT